MIWKPGDKLRNKSTMKQVVFRKYADCHPEFFFREGSGRPLKSCLYIKEPVTMQKQIFDVTRSLGYSCDKKSTIKKLKEELKEFKKAPFKLPSFAKALNKIKDDKEFVKEFELLAKDTELDEIPDMVFVLNSYCEYRGYDMELLKSNKLRYNRLRGWLC